MRNIDSYSPVKVIFGTGRLAELAEVRLPGKNALICVTNGRVKRELAGKVQELLRQNNTESVIFDKVVPNPTKSGVMEAVTMARENNCDFFIGLGGGSCIDTAKAAAAMMKCPGDLWDYASSETGGKKEITDAYPVVAISTTAGTGTECDCWFVITNDETSEKLDFGADCLYPAIAIIDPELTLSLPERLTAFQGLDALFHAVENYICNNGESQLVELYAAEAIRIITRWLPVAVKDGSNIEARSQISYAANVLEGFNQSLTFVTSHHIIGQRLGGVFPDFPHGATLSTIAEEYYKEIKKYIPDDFEKLGEFMGEESVPGDPGQSYINGLCKLLDACGVRNVSMSEFGVEKEKFPDVAHGVVDIVGIEMDRYTLTKEDITGILNRSFR